MTGNGSTTLRRYEVRSPKGGWLATVIISDDGYFSTISEYGNYAYWWGSAEGDFRAFLARLNDDYLCTKLGRGRSEYRGEETLRNVKRCIIDARRHGGLTRATARHHHPHVVDLPQVTGQQP